MESCIFHSGVYEEIVKYLTEISRSNGTYAEFLGYPPFKTMQERRILPVGTLVRRSFARGGADDLYRLTLDGMLEGVMGVEMYPGMEGRFFPDNLLSEEVAKDGWSLSPMSVSRIVRTLQGL